MIERAGQLQDWLDANGYGRPKKAEPEAEHVCDPDIDHDHDPLPEWTEGDMMRPGPCYIRDGWLKVGEGRRRH